METRKAHCEPKEFLDHQKFYDYLIKLQSLDQEQNGRHLFRGVRDAEKHTLLPTAWRDDAQAWFMAIGASLKYLPKGDLGIELYEAAALSQFYRRATEMGLNLPVLSVHVHRLLTYNTSKSVELLTTMCGQEDPHLDELWAAAQHYGLKTRLLDWSRSSGAAMTFAGRGALNHMHTELISGSRKALNEYVYGGSNKIAVWVLNRDNVEQSNELLREHGPPSLCGDDRPRHIAFIDPPTQSNPNIVAQLGTFTRSALGRSPYETLDVSIAKNELCWAKSEADLGPQPTLRKVTLPVSEVIKLLKLLRQHNMDAAKLHPGFSGCATMVDEYSKLKQVEKYLTPSAPATS